MKTLRLTHSLAAAALAAAMLCPSLAAQERVEVAWTDLPRTLNGRVVSTVLVNGTVLRGRVIEASADDLRFEVKETSNHEFYAKGERSIPRSQLSVLSYTERRGHWRAIGTAIGGAAGVMPAWFVCNLYRCGENYQNSGVGVVLAAAMVGGGAALGYGIGHGADTRTVTVFVAKDVE